MVTTRVKWIVYVCWLVGPNMYVKVFHLYDQARVRRDGWRRTTGVSISTSVIVSVRA